MLLSIIIPMYNSEPYIGECLDSILNQGVDSAIYEIVIVNDGSKDKSVEIVKGYQEKHPNIKLYSYENGGQSVARNKGMAKANGEYIQFVDSDDVLIPNSLLQIVKFAESSKHESFEMITFGICGGKDSGIIRNYRNGECTFQGNGIDYIATHNYNNGPWYYWLKRDFVSQHHLNFEEGKLCEDGMFTLTALLNANTLAHIDSNVYYYVTRPNSTTTTNDSKRRKKIIDGFKYAIKYFDTMLDKHKGMSQPCRERVKERRGSYVFFLLVRLLKMGDSEFARQTISDLKKQDAYPILNFPGKDYTGRKFKIITALFNNQVVYLSLCKLYGLKSMNR